MRLIDAHTLAAHFMCLPPDYYHTSYIVGEIMAAPTVHGLDSIKEQEPLAVNDPGAICPNCKWPLYPEDHPHYCGNCGRKVKWDAAD